MATYYVSKSTDNGYAVGSDVNDGLTKSTPKLTVSAAITVAAASGDTIVVNSGVYSGTELGANGYVLLTKALTIQAEVRRTVTFRTTSASGVYRCQGPAGGTQTISGIILDGAQSSVTPNYTVFLEDAATLYTVNVVDCDIRDAVFYLVYVTATRVALSLTNSVFSASSAVGTRSLVYCITALQGGLTISNVSGTLAKHTTPAFGLVNWKATASGVTASVTGLTATVNLDPTLTSTGEHFGVQIVNCANALIKSCNVSVVGAYGSRTSCLYRITADAAISATFGTIVGCLGSNLTTGGYLAVIGADGASSGDNQTDNGLIANNVLYGNNGASQNMHGIMLGFNRGGALLGNTVYDAGIGCLVKQNNPSTSTMPALIAGNTVWRPYSQGLRVKGAIGTLVYGNSVVTVYRPGGSWTVLVDNDGGTNSTGVKVVQNEIVSIGHLQPAVAVGSGSTAEFSRNNYYSDQKFPADMFAYQGTTYQTVSQWNASGVASDETTTHPWFSGSDAQIQPMSSFPA